MPEGEGRVSENRELACVLLAASERIMFEAVTRFTLVAYAFDAFVGGQPH